MALQYSNTIEEWIACPTAFTFNTIKHKDGTEIVKILYD